MEAIVTLVGVMLGGGLALVGQNLAQRSATKQRQADLIFDAASTVVALGGDYRNRVWEERKGLATEAVAAWDFAASRSAHAKLRLLTGDPGLLRAAADLQAAGTRLGKAWRLGAAEGPEVDQAWTNYCETLDRFSDTASVEVRKRYGLR